MARNFLHGPSQRRLDLSLFKDFPLPRSARLQLRVEAYNVTNAVNFANPNGALGNAAFGTITSNQRHAAADAVCRRSCCSNASAPRAFPSAARWHGSRPPCRDLCQKFSLMKRVTFATTTRSA